MKKAAQGLLFFEEALDIVLPQAGEKRSHPSADVQVINGVPNADYRHLKAVGFALLRPISDMAKVYVNPSPCSSSSQKYNKRKRGKLSTQAFLFVYE